MFQTTPSNIFSSYLHRRCCDNTLLCKIVISKWFISISSFCVITCVHSINFPTFISHAHNSYLLNHHTYQEFSLDSPRHTNAIFVYARESHFGAIKFFSRYQQPVVQHVPWRLMQSELKKYDILDKSFWAVKHLTIITIFLNSSNYCSIKLR
jgi:hypothetical protein